MQANYLSRRFLTSGKPQTSFVSCFQGDSANCDGIETSLIIGDCYGQVKIHRSKNESTRDQIEKMRMIAIEIENFVNFLEKNLYDTNNS
ncbi:hypothetical protein UFOVP136_20 [uncultured Caudovirales phage]|uniref:Uncharacterized protein n=1 Tax=uncultured Caudovirales phage TaxID=2100421 RepID=A0A6J5LFK6_9CAUD|nr:hypothetical protein UFOVP136_20 [uncultured Caudovirales phage]